LSQSVLGSHEERLAQPRVELRVLGHHEVEARELRFRTEQGVELHGSLTPDTLLVEWEPDGTVWCRCHMGLACLVVSRDVCGAAVTDQVEATGQLESLLAELLLGLELQHQGLLSLVERGGAATPCPTSSGDCHSSCRDCR